MWVENTHHHPSRITITDLPREVIRLIALRIYDPLELTQQDRLTWGIFSTVDMHQERQDDLASLISFSMSCRKVRREVRRILFTCVRVSGVHWAEEVIANREGWARYVKSIIIDLSMFDSDPEASTRSRLSPIDFNQSNPTDLITSSTNIETAIALKPRTCWAESSLLTSLLNSLPSLNHLSFFADASDDSTLALLFASLIPHPSLHAIPPTVISNSPSTFSTISGSGSGGGFQGYEYGHIPHYTQPHTFIPLTHRLKSFGWRQRAAPPLNFRQFSQSSTFVSTLHLLRHSYNLKFLVLDADLDEMNLTDILSPLKELNLRKSPIDINIKNQLVSLMLCGPIKNWNNKENNFLNCLINTFDGIKELFIDRPLKKETQVKETSFEDFTNLLQPLSSLPYLRLLQVGSYTFTTTLQSSIVKQLSKSIPTLIVVGLLGEEGETIWWGIWRRASMRGLGLHSSASTEGEYDEYQDIRIKFLNDGDLRILEDENEDWIRKSQPPTPPPSNPSSNQLQLEREGEGEGETEEDIRMTPRNTQSPLNDPKQFEKLHALGLTLDGSSSGSSTQPGSGPGSIFNNWNFANANTQDTQSDYNYEQIGNRGVSDGQGRRIMSLDRLMD